MINLVKILDKEIEKQIKLTPHPSNRASEAGHPCIRFLVLSRLKPEEKELPSIDLQRIFAEGNLHERDILLRLQQSGLQIIEQQRPFEWKKFELTGHIDAKISINGKAIPLEIKSCSPNIFPAIKPLSGMDLVKAKQSWVRRYPAQILLYMLMSNSEEGIMLIKCKGTGEISQKEFYLTEEALEYADEILKKLEKVNEYVAKKEVPPAEWIDECETCAFRRTACLPDFKADTLNIQFDPELEAKLNRYWELKPLATEFDEIAKELRERFQGQSVLLWPYLIESKEYTYTAYEIPPDIKSQYAQKRQGFRFSVKKLE